MKLYNQIHTVSFRLEKQCYRTRFSSFIGGTCPISLLCVHFTHFIKLLPENFQTRYGVIIQEDLKVKNISHKFQQFLISGYLSVKHLWRLSYSCHSFRLTSGFLRKKGNRLSCEFRKPKTIIIQVLTNYG
jgi:hypothetical protein